MTPISGLVSGVDSKSIVDALINVQRGATKVTEGRKATFQAKLDLTRQFNSKLLTAQLDVSALRRNSTFQARTASSSAAGALTATASSSVATGSYTFTVEQAAAAHQIATRGFASAGESLGTGSVTFQAGNGALATVTLDATNNTLNGLASAINAANAGVKAQVINDGSASPYRLVLSSNATGAANTVSFDASGLTGGLSSAFERVVAGGTNTSTGVVALNGVYSGASLPTWQLRATAAGDQTTATFEASSDGGATWNAVTNTAGTITLGNGLSATLGAGTYDLNDTWTLQAQQQLAAAQDAKVKYGTGTSSISVTSSTNTLSQLVPGLTLNVQPGATANTVATITVGNDPEPGKKAVKTFVESLNSAITFFSEQSRYDSTTKTAGALASENGLRRGLDSLVRDFLSTVPGQAAGFGTLADVGITIDKDKGTIVLEENKFAAKLGENPEALSRLFVSTGTSTKTGIEFSSLNDRTKTDTPFTVSITQAATQASVTGSALGATTVINSGNNRFSVAIGGVAREVTLAAGSYTRTGLAEHIASALNTAIGSAVPQVSASIDGANGLRLSTTAYGKSQSIQVLEASTNSARSTLGLALVGSTGSDVAGTINGVAGTGNGQALSGAAGTSADGLRLLVTATSPVADARVTVQTGVGQRAANRLLEMTRASTGTVPQREGAFTKIIDDLDKTIKKDDERLTQRRRTLEARFVEMEKIMAKYQNLGSYLSNQLAFNPDAGKKK